MVKWTELDWDTVADELRQMAENLGYRPPEERDRLLARGLQLLMERTERLQVRPGDLLEQCPACGGSGEFREGSETGRGYTRTMTCTSSHGKRERLTPAGEAVARIVRWVR